MYSRARSGLATELYGVLLTVNDNNMLIFGFPPIFGPFNVI